MCGICGIAVPEKVGRNVDQGLLVRMRDVMEHRGPDDANLYIDGSVGLGHRRLSIVDLSGGKQPMANEDGSIWISFNGEIYNHKDFRHELEAHGHRYTSASDTETIIHLYEELGASTAEKLRGMFAYAIWDRKNRRLVLTRDRLGIKPLYYYLTDEGVIYFASEIKSLLEVQALRPELNYNALSEYLANRFTTGEETLFKGVKRLLPGHTLVWSEGRIEIKQYWEVSFHKQSNLLSDDKYVAQFQELFDEAVSLRLMADVPLGAFLSGGIDSSAIVASMSKMMGEPVKTFSVGFAERDANELAYARTIAHTFKTEHHEIVVSPEQFFQALPALVYQEDEPIAHPSSLPLYFVSELAREHVKVVLTGEGSDELLAGYGKYRTTVFNLAVGSQYHSITPQIIRDFIKGAIKGVLPSSLRRKLERTFLFLTPEISEIYFDNFSVFSRQSQIPLFTQEASERMRTKDPYKMLLQYADASDAEMLLDKLLAIDLKTYLHELLMKQDQMSMAASIESRVPFLDHKLVEFAAGLPVKMKMRGLTTKYILRRAMRDRLPKEILTRKKMGFPVPVGAWLRGKFSYILDEYVLSPRALERGIFNPDFVRNLVHRHRAGEQHDERLWALINFEIWQRQFFDGEEVCRALGVAQAAKIAKELRASLPDLSVALSR